MKTEKYKCNDGTYFYYYIKDSETTIWYIYHGLFNYYNHNKCIGYIYKHQNKGFWIM